MKATQFKALLDSLGSLTPSQRKKLAATLSPTTPAAPPSRALDRLQPGACPHCSSEQVVRNGMADGLQRYLCRGCSKTFNATTGTPLSRLRDKEQFEAYADCVRQGLSVRAAASQVGVSVDKAFRWRHRFLQSVVSQQPKGVAGILEVDETYFRESRRGLASSPGPLDTEVAEPRAPAARLLTGCQSWSGGFEVSRTPWTRC